MRSLICPKCGNYLERGEYVCSRCGTAVLQEGSVLRTAAPARRASSEEQTVLCPGCGSEERASLRYCSRCGTRLTALTPTPVLTKKRSRLGLWLGLAAVALAAGVALLYLQNDRFSQGSRGAITLESRSLPTETTEPVGSETGSAALSQQQAEELLQRTYGCSVELEEKTAEGYAFRCIKGERTQHSIGTVLVNTDGSIHILSGMQSIIGRVDVEHLAELLSASGASNVSCAVVDLSTGELTGTDALNTPMSSSVLIDLPILYTVAQKAADGSLSMEDNVSVVTGGGGRGSLNAFKGKRLTVSEILQYIFLYSSNDATNSMIDFLGKDAIGEYCRKAGFESVRVANHIGKTKGNTDNDNYVSTADLCRILDELYNGGSDTIDRDFLQHNLVLSGSDTTANKGLSKKLSGGLIGCFNAFTEKKYNEIMWVEYSDCAYAVAFMANGASVEKLRRTAAEIGAYVDKALRTEPTIEPAPTLPEE